MVANDAEVLLEMIKKRIERVKVNAEDWQMARAYEDISNMIDTYESQ